MLESNNSDSNGVVEGVINSVLEDVIKREPDSKDSKAKMKEKVLNTHTSNLLYCTAN